jgi:hypothetical protein
MGIKRFRAAMIAGLAAVAALCLTPASPVSAGFSGNRDYLSQPQPLIRGASCIGDILIGTISITRDQDGASEDIQVTVLGVSHGPTKVLDPVPVNITLTIYSCSTALGLVVFGANTAGESLPWVWIDYNPSPQPVNVFCDPSIACIQLPFNPGDPNAINGIGVAQGCPASITYPTSLSGCRVYREIP